MLNLFCIPKNCLPVSEKHGKPTARHGKPTARYGKPTARQGKPTTRHGKPAPHKSRSSTEKNIPTALGTERRFSARLSRMDNKHTTHKWVVKITIVIMDTILLIFLIWFGITHSLFNWGTDWWYSLLTLLQILRFGNTMNWNNKED